MVKYFEIVSSAQLGRVIDMEYESPENCSRIGTLLWLWRAQENQARNEGAEMPCGWARIYFYTDSRSCVLRRSIRGRNLTDICRLGYNRALKLCRELGLIEQREQ